MTRPEQWHMLPWPVIERLIEFMELDDVRHGSTYGEYSDELHHAVMNSANSPKVQKIYENTSDETLIRLILEHKRFCNESLVLIDSLLA